MVAGRLYTLPEDTRKKGADFPVWRWDGTAWSQPFLLPRATSSCRSAPISARTAGSTCWSATSTASGASPAASAPSRSAATGIAAEETVLQTDPGVHDNLEGLSVWRDGRGTIRLTMVSDDNQKFYLRHEIVEYAFPRLLGAGGMPRPFPMTGTKSPRPCQNGKDHDPPSARHPCHGRHRGGLEHPCAVSDGRLADLGCLELSLRLSGRRSGTNRLQGPSAARKVVMAGFITGIGCSFIGTQITATSARWSRCASPSVRARPIWWAR
jgi:hypothetical protein